LGSEPTSRTIRVGAQKISFGGKRLAGRKLAAYCAHRHGASAFRAVSAHDGAGERMEGPVMVKRMNHRAAAHLARGLLAKVPKSTSAARNRATRESSNTIDLAE